MTGVLIGGGNLNAEACTQGDLHKTIKAEIRVMLSQAKEPNSVTSWASTSCTQSHETVDFCCVSPLVCSTLLWQPSRINTEGKQRIKSLQRTPVLRGPRKEENNITKTRTGNNVKGQSWATKSYVHKRLRSGTEKGSRRKLVCKEHRSAERSKGKRPCVSRKRGAQREAQRDSDPCASPMSPVDFQNCIPWGFHIFFSNSPFYLH